MGARKRGQSSEPFSSARFFESLPVPVLVTDAKGLIVSWNGPMTEAQQTSAVEALGKHHSEVFSLTGETESPIESCLASPEKRTIEGAKIAGFEAPSRLTVAPVFDDAETLEALVVTCEPEQHKEELEEL